MAKLVSKTYGEALFEIAMEDAASPEAKAQEFLSEIRQIRSLLAQNPDFDKLMLHPGIPKQEKLEAMRAVFGGRASDEITGFLETVIAKERYGSLPDIFQYFEDKVKEMSHIGVAHVTTAMQLDEEQKAKVRAKLLETTDYRTMEINYAVDASLIGGMVIRINDRVVDSSVRTKLDELTKQLLQIQLG